MYYNFLNLLHTFLKLYFNYAYSTNISLSSKVYIYDVVYNIINKFVRDYI